MSSVTDQLVEAVYCFNLLCGSSFPSCLIEQRDVITNSGDCEVSEESCMSKIGQCLKTLQRAYVTEIQRSTMLQEFLVNELNHNEVQGSELRCLKEELDSVSKQRDNYKMKCESQLAEMEMLTSKADRPSLSSSDDLLDMRLLGKFIGKTFPGFGVFYATIATYEKPYYKLVYEDGDCEDMTPHEVKRLLVERSDIPPDTVASILQKSDEFDFAHPEDCFTGLNVVPPGEEEGRIGEEPKEERVDESVVVDSCSSANRNGGDDIKSEEGGGGSESSSRSCRSSSGSESNSVNACGNSGSNSSSNSNSNSGSSSSSSGGSGSGSGAGSACSDSKISPLAENSTNISSSTASGPVSTVAPVYSKNCGEKYVACPYCQKMFHRMGIANHISRKCGKQADSLSSRVMLTPQTGASRTSPISVSSGDTHNSFDITEGAVESGDGVCTLPIASHPLGASSPSRVKHDLSTISVKTEEDTPGERKRKVDKWQDTSSHPVG